MSPKLHRTTTAAKRSDQTPTVLSAEQFVGRLKTFSSAQRAKDIQRYFKHGDADQFIGVPMGQIFALAKEFIDMPLDEIERLLESPIHEARVGAVSIMDWQARRKKTPEARRKALFELYLRRHDRINNWDLVDRSARMSLAAICSTSRASLYTS